MAESPTVTNFKSMVNRETDTITGKIDSINTLLDTIIPMINTLLASGNPSHSDLNEIREFVLRKLSEIGGRHSSLEDKIRSILNKLNPSASGLATASGLANAATGASGVNVSNINLNALGQTNSVLEHDMENVEDAIAEQESIATLNTQGLNTLPTLATNAQNVAPVNQNNTKVYENVVVSPFNPNPNIFTKIFNIFTKKNWGSQGKVTIMSNYIQVVYTHITQYTRNTNETTLYFYSGNKPAGLDDSNSVRVNKITFSNDNTKNKYKLLLATDTFVFGLRLPSDVTNYDVLSKDFQRDIYNVLKTNVTIEGEPLKGGALKRKTLRKALGKTKKYAGKKGTRRA